MPRVSAGADAARPCGPARFRSTAAASRGSRAIAIGQRGANAQPAMSLQRAQARHAFGQRSQGRAAPRSSADWRAAGSAYRDAPVRANTLRAGPYSTGAPGIEHEDVVADLRREPQVVGDEQHRRVVALLHLGDQLARCAPGW